MGEEVRGEGELEEENGRGEKEVFTFEEYPRMQRVRTSGALDNVVRNR